MTAAAVIRGIMPPCGKVYSSVRQGRRAQSRPSPARVHGARSWSVSSRAPAFSRPGEEPVAQVRTRGAWAAIHRNAFGNGSRVRHAAASERYHSRGRAAEDRPASRAVRRGGSSKY